MRRARPLALLVSATAMAAVLVPLGQLADADSPGISALYGADEPGRAQGPVGVPGRRFTPYVGTLHAHSGYSDGWPGSTPATYFASAKKNGLDFLGSSDHSDFLAAPIVTSDYCYPDSPEELADIATQLADTASCVGGDPDPLKTLTKWEATKGYAAAATTPAFSAFQGFEWSSDVYGHINAYFSKNMSNAKVDGYPTPKTFYDWATRRPELGGGSDAVLTFNHPGAKDLLKPVREGLGAPDSTSLNWNDFAFDPRLDQQMAGLEVFNDGDEFGSTRDTALYPEGYYAHVLDKGWHVAPVGAEDLGHRKSDVWGGPTSPKTVILASNRSPAALRAAMLARRVYAVRDERIRLDLTVGGLMMGSRLSAPTGKKLAIRAKASWPGHRGLTLQLVTSKGKVVAQGKGEVKTTRAAGPAEKYYFIRVLEAGKPVAYSAPVWVSAAKGAAIGEWLAGDFHVHTCYSHDSYCPREQKGSYFGDPNAGLDSLGLGDSNTDLEEGYTFSGTVRERFAEAAAKGLDFLAVTDHHSDGNLKESGAKSVNDAGFGTSGVLGVPAYENSIQGHAQMLGATRVYPAGKQDAAAINAMARRLRADGGLFQANHPSDKLEHSMASCRDTGDLNWRYGYDVRVDSVEVWNYSHLLQPPLPAQNSNADSIFYWECMLNRGWRVAATGGSDSHWLAIAALQGLGNPTTWAFASERSARGLLEAVRNGRTSISLQPPITGATQLLLEADADRDGTFESMIGDTVRPGTPMRVRALGLPGFGFVEVRANGVSLLKDELLAPGGVLTFTSPRKAGWVRATLSVPDAAAERKATCDDALGQVVGVLGQTTTYCRNQLALLALTSPIYLR
jgi:predicted metal-dependent phosphoesterase TrpH